MGTSYKADMQPVSYAQRDSAFGCRKRGVGFWTQVGWLAGWLASPSFLSFLPSQTVPKDLASRVLMLIASSSPTFFASSDTLLFNLSLAGTFLTACFALTAPHLGIIDPPRNPCTLSTH